MISWISKYLSPFFSTQSIEPHIILNASVLAIDLETTGLDTKRDYILEAALLPISGFTLKIHQTEYMRLKTNGYSSKSAHVHGILQSEAQIPENEGLNRIAALVKGKWIVGHHGSFDCEILKHRCAAHSIEFRPKGLIDTQLMAVKLDTGAVKLHEISAKNYSLQSLCKRFSIPMEDEHTAAGDTLATGILFVKLLKVFTERKMLVPANVYV